MPKLRLLSGEDVIAILKSFGFVVAGQKGSHVKMKRVTDDDAQTLTIPNHRELDKGTIKAIFNQMSKYISTSELKKHFYAKK